MSGLKVGDRCVIVGLPPDCIGRRLLGVEGKLCTVAGPAEWTNNYVSHRIEFDQRPPQAPPDESCFYCAQQYLIKLPPDDEAKRLFSETQQPLKRPVTA